MNVDGSTKAAEFEVSAITNFHCDAARKLASIADIYDSSLLSVCRTSRTSRIDSKKKGERKKIW